MIRALRTGVRSLCAALGLLVVWSSEGRAQTSTWRVAAGAESFTFRDIAKSRPPVDASPVRWRGSGPTLAIDYDRTRPLRLHRFGMTASANGGFVYDTGFDVTTRPDEDSASFVAGRYHYRRYLARPLKIMGLHAGVGVAGFGERRVLRHHYAGDIELTEKNVTGTIAIVTALRFRRSDRFGVEATWTEGASLAHGNQRHVAGVTSDHPSWGGGWLTDLAASADVRLTARAALRFSYGHDGEGLLFNHRSNHVERRRVMAGLTYAP
jgi:hypothetical protein